MTEYRGRVLEQWSNNDQQAHTANTSSNVSLNVLRLLAKPSSSRRPVDFSRDDVVVKPAQSERGKFYTRLEIVLLEYVSRIRLWSLLTLGQRHCSDLSMAPSLGRAYGGSGMPSYQNSSSPPPM